MSNVKSIISQHNKKVLSGGQSEIPRCECDLGVSPVENRCGIKGVVYQATVSYDGDKTDTYTGLTERKFIERHKEHLTNFETRNKKNSTKLSRKIWDLQDKNKIYEIKWKILQQSKPYYAGGKECRLCLEENGIILFQPEKASLNSRTEIFNKCRHMKNSSFPNFELFQFILLFSNFS